MIGDYCRRSDLSERVAVEQRSEEIARGLVSKERELQVEGRATAKALGWEYA